MAPLSQAYNKRNISSEKNFFSVVASIRTQFRAILCMSSRFWLKKKLKEYVQTNRLLLHDVFFFFLYSSMMSAFFYYLQNLLYLEFSGDLLNSSDELAGVLPTDSTLLKS